MKILLLGNGGREHALAWKISQSAHCEKLYIASGNAGTIQHGENIEIDVNDFGLLETFCQQKFIEMVIVGSEAPLVKGITDFFAGNAYLRHIYIIGPGMAGAQLEGSKAYAKDFMKRHNIPTAAYKEFTAQTFYDGLEYIKHHQLPVVLKADGLASGKGVVICYSHEDAGREFELMLNGKFGSAGSKVVMEQFLTGIELTVIILSDGDNYVILPSSKDYKKIGAGDVGLNTGGMGAVSPPQFVTYETIQKIDTSIIGPTLEGLKKDDIQYKGFLYFGLIKNGDDFYVIEYNCRLGDPETQAILPRIKNDIVELFIAASENKLSEIKMAFDERACATVILASHGYPEKFDIGKPISGLENTENCMLFHAGTKLDENGTLLTNGGRVMAVSCFGNNLSEALRNCYVNAGRIYFESRYFRNDIGWDATKN